MFNRISLWYTASAPMQGGIAYDIGGETVRDTFWLESGENAGFSLLIQGALDGKTADNCRLISLSAADGTSAKAEIHGISTDLTELPDEPWIEQDGVRLGITLEMGGAIASLTDSRSPDGYTNLLNRYDPGRLVQQSYYGISEPPYVLGEFMGNPWAYNPVQGGDKGGNRSRIIAYSRTENEIYIKAQPYDWGHIGHITPSYMENRYRFLTNGVISVENRFTDFSGYSHPPRHQELPAFYVVSALDIFTWEDAGVRRSRDDLIFWPLASDQQFLLTEPDTAFSVWHDRNGYGVGLAAPGTEMFYAGRHEHSGSADPHDNGTNYTAPLKVVQLRSFKPLTYRYLLAVGDIESIAARFRETLPNLDNSSLSQYGG